MRRRRIIPCLSLSVLSLLVIGALLHPAKTLAETVTYQNISDAGIPAPVTHSRPGYTPYDGRCTDSAGNNYVAGQNSWISTYNGVDFSQTAASVPYSKNGQSVDLNVVIADLWCNGTAPINTGHRVSSVDVSGGSGGASVSGMANNTIFNVPYPSHPYDFPPTTNWSFVSVAAAHIKVALPANLTPGTYTYTVNLRGVARINGYTDGYDCVQSGGPRSGSDRLEDYVGCAEGDAGLPFTITILPPPDQAPVGSAAGSCAQISGHVLDPDDPNASLVIGVFVDGQPGGLLTTADGRSGGGRHGFVINSNYMNQYADTVQHVFTIKAYGVDKNGVPNGNNPTIATMPIGPCRKPTCSITPDQSIEAGSQFQVNFTMNYSPGSRGVIITNPNTYVMKIAISGGLLPQKNNVPYNVPVPGPGNPGNHTETVTAGAPGTYIATMSLTALAGVVTCQTQITVSGKPYVQVFGADVQAGGQFAPSAAGSCSGPAVADAGIFTHNTGNLGNYKGSQGQFAAFALDKVAGFVSAGERITAPQSPTGLTFGNTNQAGPVTDYGGSSGIYHCAPNYYGLKGSLRPTVSSAYTLRNGDAVQYFTPLGGPLIIDSVGAFSGHQAIYVRGDVTIASDIIFNDGWAGVGDIPSLWIVASGNIKIDQKVKEVDGVYVAQPSAVPSGGTIYTCTNDANLFLIDALYTSCNSTLTVRGSFIANQVKFLRTTGTLKDASNDKDWTISHAAEIFKTDPSLYLGTEPPTLQQPNSCQAGKCGYDAITSLPPIL